MPILLQNFVPLELKRIGLNQTEKMTCEPMTMHQLLQLRKDIGIMKCTSSLGSQNLKHVLL